MPLRVIPLGYANQFQALLVCFGFRSDFGFGSDLGRRLRFGCVSGREVAGCGFLRSRLFAWGFGGEGDVTVGREMTEGDAE